LEGFPTLYGEAIIDGKKCLVFKRDGENLKTHMSRMSQVKLNFVAVHQVGMQLILLLEKLHSIGYLHRDIKPQNILVGEHKKLETRNKIKLIDFGLCIPYTKDANLLRAPLNDSEHVLPGYCQADGNAFFASLNCDKNK
jgi:serine/threonine protein kinase